MSINYPESIGVSCFQQFFITCSECGASSEPGDSVEDVIHKMMISGWNRREFKLTYLSTPLVISVCPHCIKEQSFVEHHVDCRVTKTQFAFECKKCGQVSGFYNSYVLASQKAKDEGWVECQKQIGVSQNYWLCNNCKGGAK